MLEAPSICLKGPCVRTKESSRPPGGASLGRGASGVQGRAEHSRVQGKGMMGFRIPGCMKHLCRAFWSCNWGYVICQDGPFCSNASGAGLHGDFRAFPPKVTTAATQLVQGGHVWGLGVGFQGAFRWLNGSELRTNNTASIEGGKKTIVSAGNSRTYSPPHKLRR